MVYSRLDKVKLEKFWNDFRVYLMKKHPSTKLIKANGKSCLYSSPGISDMRIVFIVEEESVICNIYFTRTKRDWYEFLKNKESAINAVLDDSKTKWYKKKTTYHINVPFGVSNALGKTNYDEYFAWLVKNADILIDLFSKYYPEFKKYQG